MQAIRTSASIMKQPLCIGRSGLPIIMLVAFFAVVQSRPAQELETITVSGKVTEEAGQPIADAMVMIMFDISQHTTSWDSVFTKADGTFSRQVAVEQGLDSIGYAIMKTGYTPVYEEAPIVQGNADIGTVFVKESADNPGRSVQVTGRVVDSLTGLPLSDAEVHCMLFLCATVGYAPVTVHSGNDGTFSLTMTIDTSKLAGSATISLSPIILYTMSKDGYQEKPGGYSVVNFDPIDIGDIQLAKPNSSILQFRRFAVRTAPVSSNGFTLRGQKIPRCLLGERHGRVPSAIIRWHSGTDNSQAEKFIVVK